MAEVFKFELILCMIVLRILHDGVNVVISHSNLHPLAVDEQPFSTSSLFTMCCSDTLGSHVVFYGRGFRPPGITRYGSRRRICPSLAVGHKVGWKSVSSLFIICLLLSGDVKINPGPKYRFRVAGVKNLCGPTKRVYSVMSVTGGSTAFMNKYPQQFILLLLMEMTTGSVPSALCHLSQTVSLIPQPPLIIPPTVPWS